MECSIGQNVAIQMLENLKSLVYRLYLIHLRLFNNSLILIYQMGKVGSSSLEFSVKQNSRHPVFKVHFLSDHYIEMCKSSLNSRIGDTEFRKSMKLSLIQMNFIKESLNRSIAKPRKNRKWKIVSIVREPVSRCISAYFQNAHLWVDDFESRCKTNNINYDQLIDDFFARTELHNQTLQWFDLEIKEVLGLDILKNEFKRQEGYGLYSFGNIELLVLKVENISQNAQLIQEYLDLKKLDLKSYNISSDKYYKNVYKEFKSRIVFSNEFLDRMYQSDYFKTFYTDQELIGFKKGWTTETQASSSKNG